MFVRRFFPRAFFVLAVLCLLLLALPMATAQAQQSVPPATGQTNAAANLRAGPGTSFAKAGSLPAGATVTITGCNKACDWYQLDSGSWIAAFLVDETEAGAAPAASPAASSTVTATATMTVTATTTATATATTTATATAKSDGNLRSGPGTSFERVGGVKVGQALDITGRNTAGDWFQLADGTWIAALLVSNAPADAKVVEAPAAPTPAPTAAAPAPGGDAAAGTGMDEAMQAWQAEMVLNQTKTCGHFEYKITDVRRKKAVWFFDWEYVAQGEWLMVFVEVKNISPGTSFFGDFSPRLVTLDKDGMMTRMTGDFKASQYAGWMFQHGGFYEDINPGKVLGLVEAYDLPLEPDMILGFGLLDCPDDPSSLGLWSKVPPATK